MTPTITDDQIMTALGQFLTAILPSGTEVVQGQENRVPQHKAANHVVMTPTNRMRLATNENRWNLQAPAPVAIDRKQSTRVSVQVDVHGPLSSDNAQTIKTLFRDAYGCDWFEPFGIQPLWASDGHQMPFVNGESQYGQRWVVTVELQASPILSTPQDFAAILEAKIMPIGSSNP